MHCLFSSIRALMAVSHGQASALLPAIVQLVVHQHGLQLGPSRAASTHTGCDLMPRFQSMQQTSYKVAMRPATV